MEAALDETRFRAIARDLCDLRGPLLPILHAIQAEFGRLPPASLPIVADVLNLSVAEVYGVATFYRDLVVGDVRPNPRMVRICAAEACQAVGARQLAADAKARLSDDIHIDEVFCLGNCGLGPSVQVHGKTYGRVTVEAIAALVAADRQEPREVSAGASSRPGETLLGDTSWGATVFVPADAAARAMGADDVASTLGGSGGRTVVRTGSRGLLWLEPMIEIDTPEGRVAFGPVSADDIDGAPCLGPVADLLAGQTRLTFGRVGAIDPRSADDHEANGGNVALRRALAIGPQAVIDDMKASGLRGRGGAGFPAGIKWQTVLDAPGDEKFICCNADEGDSGTFADRMLLEGDPFLVIEGMAIAGAAVGAREGFIYIRSEYPDAIATFTAARDAARSRGWLGPTFDIEVRVGAGSYVCGEETAMLESLEGMRGVVRAKPPLPAIEGLFGRPTVVNNVLTFAAAVTILRADDGAAAYAALGVGRSRGTQVVQLGGNIARPGIVEVPFGVSLRTLVEEMGGGTRSGRPIKAVQVGGPLGSYLPASGLDVAIDYEALAEAGGLLGHGGVVVFDDTVDMAEQARFAMEFCAEESCGKCTPCRVGAVRGVELLDQIIEARSQGRPIAKELLLLEDLCEVMTDASLCAMGGLTPLPVLSAINSFEGDFVP